VEGHSKKIFRRYAPEILPLHFQIPSGATGCVPKITKLYLNLSRILWPLFFLDTVHTQTRSMQKNSQFSQHTVLHSKPKKTTQCELAAELADMRKYPDLKRFDRDRTYIRQRGACSGRASWPTTRMQPMTSTRMTTTTTTTTWSFFRVDWSPARAVSKDVLIVHPSGLRDVRSTRSIQPGKLMSTAAPESQ